MLQNPHTTPTGKLYLIPTPIGNLGDITVRAIEVLKHADIVCAEDTRRARILFERYDIRCKPFSYRDHNAARMAPKIAGWVKDGKTVAIVSDAGTPGISDPGFRAVHSVIEAGFPLEVLPGSTAVIPALILSGLAVDRFCFEGFLPVKKGRRTRLNELAAEPRTIILFEGPHRLTTTLSNLSDNLGNDRRAAIARELTKLYEDVKRGTLSELHQHYLSNPPKGEIVIVIEGLKAFKKRMKSEG
ncbi:MAG: 16S rRNA (cytidine(1402)-2'-O)-methyltransferase [Candidatus Hatepunaea meridiana]|nr:16S rRNA (cytidine(1402)-2'-O)-methyltransferase [Candidatus Hatepunaea meridiana]